MFEDYINTELTKLKEVRSKARIKKPYRKYKRAMMYRIQNKFIENFDTELMLEDTINLMHSKVENINIWINNMEDSTKLGGNRNG